MSMNEPAFLKNALAGVLAGVHLLLLAAGSVVASGPIAATMTIASGALAKIGLSTVGSTAPMVREVAIEE